MLLRLNVLQQMVIVSGPQPRGDQPAIAPTPKIVQQQVTIILPSENINWLRSCITSLLTMTAFSGSKTVRLQQREDWATSFACLFKTMSVIKQQNFTSSVKVNCLLFIYEREVCCTSQRFINAYSNTHYKQFYSFVIFAITPSTIRTLW